MKKYYYLNIFFFLVINFSCSTTGINKNEINISGMIYDFANRPVPYCEIQLNDKYFESTDINGRFSFPKIPIGIYVISVRKEGFENYSEEIVIKELDQIIYIRIPSQLQLLNLADEALTSMNLNLAEEYIERAYQIDGKNIEMLFYYATVKFRQHKYEEAIQFLEIAKNLGSKDINIDRFLEILKGLL